MITTGRLENWMVDPLFKDHPETILWGHVFDDVRKRFVDGEWIHTSGTANRDFKEGDIVQTRNSVYILGRKGMV